MNLKNADKFGIIDIGSNTIRGVLYSGGEKPAALDTITFQSNILESTFENKLTTEGIFNLSESISEIKKGFGECEYIFAFLTSSCSSFNSALNLAKSSWNLALASIIS